MGAWLNKNPDKKVFAPLEWNRGGWGGDTAVPEDWIKIPARYDDNSNFPPFLSIIFCVENNSAETFFNLSTTLSQSFIEFKTVIPNFEVIIADISSDGEKISRRFASNDKVTYLNLNDNFDKISAWNRGLENARGEYVLFLSDEDFIFPQATLILSQVWQKFFSSSKYRSTDYICLRNYNCVGPNVVCSTQSLLEDDSGSVTVQGFNEKNFSLKVDAPFQNLTSSVELEIDGVQKLNLLASGQINNSFSTKFFKRDFLEKNSLVFHKTSGGRHRFV